MRSRSFVRRPTTAPDGRRSLLPHGPWWEYEPPPAFPRSPRPLMLCSLSQPLPEYDQGWCNRRSNGRLSGLSVMHPTWRHIVVQGRNWTCSLAFQPSTTIAEDNGKLQQKEVSSTGIDPGAVLLSYRRSHSGAPKHSLSVRLLPWLSCWVGTLNGVYLKCSKEARCMGEFDSAEMHLRKP